jgi:hypothetical protein
MSSFTAKAAEMRRYHAPLPSADGTDFNAVGQKFISFF